MTYTIVNSRRAESDIQAAASWWAEYRSAAQASRWLSGIHKQIRSLSKSPERFPQIPEQAKFSQPLRELYYGVRRKPTHRVIFTIADDLVLIVAVRHLAQGELTPDDIE